jgi:Tfp pilus assembly protein PilO
MNSQNNRQTSYIVFLEVLVIIIGIIFGIWRPLGAAKSLNQTLADKTAQLAQVKDKEAKLAQLKIELNKKKEGVEKLNIAVPEKPEVAQALIILEAIAVRAGVELTELHPEEGESGEVIITVSFKSDFNQLKEMFSLMYKDLRPVKVKTIKTLGPGNVDEESQKLEKRPLSTVLEIEMPYAGKISSLQAGGEVL